MVLSYESKFQVLLLKHAQGHQYQGRSLNIEIMTQVLNPHKYSDQFE